LQPIITKPNTRSVLAAQSIAPLIPISPLEPVTTHLASTPPHNPIQAQEPESPINSPASAQNPNPLSLSLASSPSETVAPLLSANHNSSPSPSQTHHQNPTHPMTTRSKNNITQPKHFIDGTVRYPIPKALLVEAHLDPNTVEPTYFTIANKNPYWRHAMNLEFDAHMKNGTWVLTPPSPSQNLIGCKWVYWIK
jgi:hypothetical protein